MSFPQVVEKIVETLTDKPFLTCGKVGEFQWPGTSLSPHLSEIVKFSY